MVNEYSATLLNIKIGDGFNGYANSSLNGHANSTLNVPFIR